MLYSIFSVFATLFSAIFALFSASSVSSDGEFLRIEVALIVVQAFAVIFGQVVGSSSVGIHSHLVKITVGKKSQLENFSNCHFLPTADFTKCAFLPTDFPNFPTGPESGRPVRQIFQLCPFSKWKFLPSGLLRQVWILSKCADRFSKQNFFPSKFFFQVWFLSKWAFLSKWGYPPN